VAKVESGEFDATLLASAGLKRIGLEQKIAALLPLEHFPPACGQGTIAIECRADDARARALLAPINHRDSSLALACERAFLAALDGSCKTPIAGLAEIADGILRFRGLILAPDGSEWYDVEVTGTTENFRNIGADAGEELRTRAGPEFIASLV